MAAFMVQFSYTEQGAKGLIKEGGSKRREATEQLIKSLGGKLVAYYFAFGEYDGVAIAFEIPTIIIRIAILSSIINFFRVGFDCTHKSNFFFII